MNLAVPRSQVRLGSVEDHDPRSTEGIWMDPARRAAAARVRRARPRECAPFSTCSTSPTGSGRRRRGPRWAQARPGVDRPAPPSGCSGSPGTGRCSSGLVRPLAAGASPPRRWSTATATIGRGEEATDQRRARWAAPPEPDGAVIRAGLIGRSLRISTPTRRSPTRPPTAASTPSCGYTVRDVMPFGLKRLTARTSGSTIWACSRSEAGHRGRARSCAMAATTPFRRGVRDADPHRIDGGGR